MDILAFIEDYNKMILKKDLMIKYDISDHIYNVILKKYNLKRVRTCKTYRLFPIDETKNIDVEIIKSNIEIKKIDHNKQDIKINDNKINTKPNKRTKKGLVDEALKAIQEANEV